MTYVYVILKLEMTFECWIYKGFRIVKKKKTFYKNQKLYKTCMDRSSNVISHIGLKLTIRTYSATKFILSQFKVFFCWSLELHPELLINLAINLFMSHAYYMYVMRQFVQSAELILRHLNEVKSVQQEGKKCRNELSNIEKSHTCIWCCYVSLEWLQNLGKAFCILRSVLWFSLQTVETNITGHRKLEKWRKRRLYRDSTWWRTW